MFAVKGWSVSADNLMPEAGGALANTPAKKSRKRKRASQSENVTSSNIADMWDKVIDHKEQLPKRAPKPEKSQPKETEKQCEKAKKRQKLNPGDAKSEKGSDSKQPSTKKDGKQEQDAEDMDAKPAKKDQKDKKDKKKGKKDKQAPREVDDTPASKDAATKAVAPVPAPPKLTPLQASMREKLISARFRHLNETLYTRPSAEAFSLFNESPEMFTEYHEGFRRQVEVWPQNPVENFLAEVRRRARQRQPPKNQHRGGGQQDAAKADVMLPLPRNRATNVCTIADLGCGDARLASELQREKAKLKLDVLSFDLHSPHPLVTKADIANLPLANSSVDVAIFCLALMGTNWVDFLEEAYRVLRWKGELWIAEIKSRLGGGMSKGGAGGVVEHSVGNRRKTGPAAAPPPKKGVAKKEAEAANEAALLVEVDGEDDTRQQTDVSAFVEVLNKRGFMLQGQDQGRGSNAVDLSNKMFVTMHFVKSAPAVKGKCAQKEEDRDRLSGKPAFLKKPKFIDDDSRHVNEAAVLKPCVYKIR
ncbi:putative methyltransferase domain-containing protein [Diaporthe ampelina]|uniref:Ribosomal RNA-processing protein 8 n=1 Tax=Diaporthe ampelina TaxID=1214573 RepID=A0A0G2HG97_9PEZI|nr:putative methyltransferase domain-containing protein [Diaporthe ampelina]